MNSLVNLELRKTDLDSYLFAHEGNLWNNLIFKVIRMEYFFELNSLVQCHFQAFMIIEFYSGGRAVHGELRGDVKLCFLRLHLHGVGQERGFKDLRI